MKLIVGLGNPGSAYKNSRHNVGFMALDRYVEGAGGSSLFKRHGSFKPDKHLQALKADITPSKEKALLLKPQTYMNNSGRSVRAALDYYQLRPEDVLIVYDELALAFGTIRSRSGGESAGHNGIKSITSHIGADFMRLRIGISNQYSSNQPSEQFVLSNFTKEEQELLPSVLDRVAECIEDFYNGELSTATFRVE